MPRVDIGMYLVESANIFTLGRQELMSLRDWALASGAIFVTSPSIVSVSTASGPVRLAAGVGSLISSERPPVRWLQITSQDWVDGCPSGSREPNYHVADSGDIKVKGVAVAIDYRDPPSLMANSMRIEALLRSQTEGQPLLVLVDYETGRQWPLMTLREGTYEINAAEGKVRDLLEYAASLYSSCPHDV
ncbi:hypothetical protein [Acidilobus sp.]|uniref:hypothetical protein n=1 Tax=Acidilobus sp. TaxID=1872109 RepID=UPI003D08BDAC